jgi:hypothetical protein
MADHPGGADNFSSTAATKLAIYKYTIVADGCDPETQANDPGIRVNK